MVPRQADCGSVISASLNPPASFHHQGELLEIGLDLPEGLLASFVPFNKSLNVISKILLAVVFEFLVVSKWRKFLSLNLADGVFDFLED